MAQAICLAVFLAAMGVASGVAGQSGSSPQAPELVAGERIRVTAPEFAQARFTATVDRIGSEELVLLVSRGGQSEIITLDRSLITGLERSEGMKSRGMRNAGYGFLIGAGLGVVIGAAAGDDPDDLISFTWEMKAAVAGLGLGALGLVVGAVSGVTSPTERWTAVPTDRLRLGVTPAKQFQLSYSFGF